MDGTKEAQDATTSESTTETSEKETETFTKEQVEEISRKVVSDALAKAGRTDKALKAREDAVKSAKAELTEAQREKDQAERESARDDPDKLTVVRARHELRDAKSKLATVETELEATKELLRQKEEEGAETTKERNAREIATRLEVDSKTLIKLAKVTDGSTEAIEEIAKELPKKGEAKTLKADSGKTIGGTSIPTDMGQFRKWIADMPQEEYEKIAPEIKEAMKQGKIK